jgi:hypothetical protein
MRILVRADNLKRPKERTSAVCASGVVIAFASLSFSELLNVNCSCFAIANSRQIRHNGTFALPYVNTSKAPIKGHAQFSLARE